MLIEGKLPSSYKAAAQYIENYYKGYNNDTSTHYWIDRIEDQTLRLRFEELRNAQEIKQALLQAYPNYDVIPVHSSDEIYISVDPSKRKFSDIALSDCHYDAPFKYVPQCDNIFIRVILSITENKTTFTTIGDKTSLLDRLDFNGMDYNSDFHCVKGFIPKDQSRMLLKLHFLCVHPTSSKTCAKFTRYINDKWTHISRESMRISAAPTNMLETILGHVIVLLSKLYNISTPSMAIGLIFLVYFLFRLRSTRRRATFKAF